MVEGRSDHLAGFRVYDQLLVFPVANRHLFDSVTVGRLCSQEETLPGQVPGSSFHVLGDAVGLDLREGVQQGFYNAAERTVCWWVLEGDEFDAVPSQHCLCHLRVVCVAGIAVELPHDNLVEIPVLL